MRVLSTDSHPDWYFESYPVEWWVRNFFATAVEVHAFQLGLLVGILFGILTIQNYPKMLAVSLALLTVFFLGAFEGTLLCGTRTEVCAHVQLKPWYFLTGAVFTKLSVIGLAAKLSSDKQTSQRLRFGHDN